jgi:formylglycine-generating enzyme required for sulfatase activity
MFVRSVRQLMVAAAVTAALSSLVMGAEAPYERGDEIRTWTEVQTFTADGGDVRVPLRLIERVSSSPEVKYFLAASQELFVWSERVEISGSAEIGAFTQSGRKPYSKGSEIKTSTVKRTFTVGATERLVTLMVRRVVIDEPTRRGNKWTWHEGLVISAGFDLGEFAYVPGKGIRSVAQLAEPVKAVPRTSPVSSEALPAGMVSMGRNEQGFEEVLWTRDSSIMVRIPAGAFTMGSDDCDEEFGEHWKPAHKPYISEFFIDKYEVSNRQYRKFCDATQRSYPADPNFTENPSYFESFLDNPVVNVSWADAVAYSVWAGKRLPTEAEWEKAARGVDGRTYPWGEQDPSEGLDGAFYVFGEYGMEESGTRPVGSFPASSSPYGVFDMGGNVWEWCQDWYSPTYYSSSPGVDPKGPTSGNERVVRGGYDGRRIGWFLCAGRSYDSPNQPKRSRGFRCAWGAGS